MELKLHSFMPCKVSARHQPLLHTVASPLSPLVGVGQRLGWQIPLLLNQACAYLRDVRPQLLQQAIQC